MGQVASPTAPRAGVDLRARARPSRGRPTCGGSIPRSRTSSPAPTGQAQQRGARCSSRRTPRRRTKQQCPSCGQDDGDPVPRFAGGHARLGDARASCSAARTSRPTEKKTLVFTDSVQDASHRAAFVESRAYALNLRALHAPRDRRAGRCTLDAVGRRRSRQPRRTAAERYAVLPPDLREHETFRQLLAEESPEPRVRRGGRDADGLRRDAGVRPVVTHRPHPGADRRRDARTSRSRTSTRRSTRRSADAARAGRPARARRGRPAAARAPWARGVARAHPDCRVASATAGSQRSPRLTTGYQIWGGRPRREGMPAFPRAAVPLRASRPRRRHAEHSTRSSAPRSWYATWTARVLGVPAVDAPRYVLALLNALAADGALAASRRRRQRDVWCDPAAAGAASRRPTGTPPRLRCSVCSTALPGPAVVLDELHDAPCQRDRCPGVYARSGPTTTTTATSTGAVRCAGSSRASTPRCSPRRSASRWRTSSRPATRPGRAQRADLHADPRAGHRHR